MPLIEGLGDEVTLVMGAILICVVLTFAWFSTHTADLPALREVGITVIERTQIRRRVPEQTQDSGSPSPEPANGVSVRLRRQTQENSQNSTSAESGSTVPDVAEADISAASNTQGSSVDNDSTNGELITDNIEHTASHVTPEIEANQHVHSQGAPNEEGVGEAPQSTSDRVIADTEANDQSVPNSKPVVEEELRRRRVQYFQNPQTASSGDSHQAESSNSAASILNSDTHESNARDTETAEKPTGLSELSRLGAASSGEEASGAAQRDLSSLSSQPINDEGDNAQPSPSSSASPTIRVKLKYMNETQRMVHASPTDTIGDFRRTHFEQELQDQNKWVRFIFNGQDLRDDSATLQAYQVGDNCTMHCLITNKVRTTPGGASGAGGRAGDDEDEDSVMGALMYPLFTLVLMVVWYFRLTYRQYFSPMSTVVLIGISFLLGLGYFSSLRTAATGNQRQQAEATGGRPGQRQDRAQMGHAHAD